MYNDIENDLTRIAGMLQEVIRESRRHRIVLARIEAKLAEMNKKEDQ
jgi:hypothetical protein